jgi:hypothetical protein
MCVRKYPNTHVCNCTLRADGRQRQSGYATPLCGLIRTFSPVACLL